MTTRCSIMLAAIVAAAACNSASALDPMLSNSATTRANAALDAESSARPGEAFFARGVKAVRRHNYPFAINMYEIASSWGYKPAQYNLGIIYFNGEGGTPVDRPRGMAWFALAAERGDKKYVEAREMAYAEMSADEFAQANVVWRELKSTHADEIALDRAKRRWVQVRNEATGSHVGGGTGPVLVGGRNMSNWNVVDDPEHPIKNPLPNTSTHTAAGITGGGAIDGTIAFRQLRQTDNPYDPQLHRELPQENVRVEPPVPVDGDAQPADGPRPRE